MPHLHRIPWLTLCSAVVLAGAGAPLLAASTPAVQAASTAPSPAAGVLWIATLGDPTRKEALFVPSALLAKVDWTDPGTADLRSLPLTADQAAKLRAFLRDAAQAPATESAECAGRVADDFGLFQPAPRSRTLAQLVQETTQIALIGRVVDRVPGWMPNSHSPAQRIVVAVVEVLNDREGRLAGASQLSFLDQHGDVHFGGLRVCDAAPAGSPPLEPGSQVLVGGFANRDNPGLLNVSLIAAVKDGRVVSSHRALRDPAPVPLGQLRDELRAARPTGH